MSITSIESVSLLNEFIGFFFGGVEYSFNRYNSKKVYMIVECSL